MTFPARLHKNHPLQLFGGSRGRACDIYIETDETAWSVKLFGMKRRTTELCFIDDRRYFIRSYIAFAAGMFARVPLDSKKRELPAYLLVVTPDERHSRGVERMNAIRHVE